MHQSARARLISGRTRTHCLHARRPLRKSKVCGGRKPHSLMSTVLPCLAGGDPKYHQPDDRRRALLGSFGTVTSLKTRRQPRLAF